MNGMLLQKDKKFSALRERQKIKIAVMYKEKRKKEKKKNKIFLAKKGFTRYNSPCVQA